MQAEKALDTAGSLGLDIEMIAPSHGCIWSGKEEVTAIINAYCKWASGKNEGKAVIVYDTMWGATAKMAEAAMSVFQDAGIPVVKHCLAVKKRTSCFSLITAVILQKNYSKDYFV